MNGINKCSYIIISNTRFIMTLIFLQPYQENASGGVRFLCDQANDVSVPQNTYRNSLPQEMNKGEGIFVLCIVLYTVYIYRSGSGPECILAFHQPLFKKKLWPWPESPLCKVPACIQKTHCSAPGPSTSPSKSSPDCSISSISCRTRLQDDSILFTLVFPGCTVYVWPCPHLSCGVLWPLLLLCRGLPCQAQGAACILLQDQRLLCKYYSTISPVCVLLLSAQISSLQASSVQSMSPSRLSS